MWWIWGLFALAGAVQVLNLATTVPQLLDEAGGMVPFDLRPFGYSYAEAQTYLARLTEDGLALYLGPNQQLDLIAPLLLAAAFVTGFRAWLPPVASLALSLVAIAGAVANYAENAMVARLLTETVTEGDVALASTLTQVKSLSLLLCLAALALLAWRAVSLRPAPRRRRRRAGH